MAPDRAVVFIDNHDTQREGSMNYKEGRNYKVKLVSSYTAHQGGVMIKDNVCSGSHFILFHSNLSSADSFQLLTSNVYVFLRAPTDG